MNNAACPITREDLTRSARVLQAGGPTKADLLELDLGDGPVVVKDFAAKSWWVRLIGRLQVRREFRAYRWLGTMPGLPRLIGRIDAHAIAIEKIDGAQLGYTHEAVLRGPDVFRQLEACLARLHARGLVHWDLRARENLLLDPDGDVYLIDLASAVWLRPGGLAHRLLFPLMQRVDRSALLKWKRILEAGPYTAEEQAFLRRFARWRSLWLVNPKRERDEAGE